MKAQTGSGPVAMLRGVWQRNHDLLRNAGSLVGSTGLAAIFGFVYWIVAAHEFTKTEVGYGSAAVNAMMLLGTIGMFGLGTMLIGELPLRRERGGLVSATLIASGLGSLALGLGFAVIAAVAFAGSFPQISGTLGRIALFSVGVGATGLTLVFDDATIGVMRGGVQLSRNLAMSIIKLAALPIGAVVLHDTFGVGLLFVWVLGTILSMASAGIMLLRGGSRIFNRPDWKALRGLTSVALSHNWLNLAIAAPPKLIPVLVVVAAGPAANAAFSVAWMMASFLFMVPASLSTVLFAIASAAPELIAEKLRFVLRLSLIIGLPAMAVLAICAHFALSLFGASYAQDATIPLWALILSYIPGLPQAQYIAVCRATGKVNKATVLLTISASCQLIAVFVGGRLGGLNGVSFAYLGVSFLIGAATAPTVLRAAYARGLERRTATTGFAALPATSSGATTGNDYFNRQEAGLAMLVAIAGGHTMDAAAAVWRTGSFPALDATAAMRRTGSFPALDAKVEMWRTGSFPAIPADDRRRQHKAQSATSVDLSGRAPAGEPLKEPSYRRRQQAGIDALIAMATPEEPDASQPEHQSTRPKR
jgi:O-antigen/teichoic acid export membrane protein